MKNKIKKCIVVLLTLSMVASVFTFDVLANDESESEKNNEMFSVLSEYCDDIDELDLTEQSVEIAMDAIEEINSDADYVDNQLIVIYSSEEAAGSAAEVITVQSEDVSETEQLGNSESVLVTVDEETTLEEAAIEIAQDENVESIQPNYIFELYDDESYESYDEYCDTDSFDVVFETEGSASVGTNDKYVSRQPYLTQVNFPEAWAVVDSQTVKNKVRVAVLDTGADMSHKDLTGINGELSVSVLGEKPYEKLTSDVSNHGTHVIGLIAATANNEIGIAGAASGGTYDLSEYLDVYAIGAFTVNEKGNTVANEANIVKGIEYAKEQNTDIINMSLGIKSWTEEKWNKSSLKKAIDEACDAGIIIICAGGNESTHTSCLNYPSDSPNVISVENLKTITADSSYSEISQADYRRYSSSCYNEDKDLCAPGAAIFSSLPENKYGGMSGTSMAAPIVTSVVALMLMVNPDLTLDDVYNTITSTATDIVYTSGSEVACAGYDIYTGYGLINAEACVKSTISKCTHVYGDYSTIREATCKEKGLRTQVCTECGYMNVEETAYADHTLKAHEEKACSCSESGNKAYFQCTYCSKYFSDENATKEISKDDWYLPPAHTLKKVADAVKKTCTTPGNIAYWQCSKCSKYFSDAAGKEEITEGSWVVPASHAPVLKEATESTCVTHGNIKYYLCNECGKGFSDAACTKELAKDSWVLPLTDHSYDNGTVTKEPTYLATGVKTYHCKNCSATKTEVIPALVPDLPAGTYYIRTSLTSNKVLDIEWGSTASGANLQLYEKNETTAQQFKITYDSSGLATITNVKSGKALDVQWGNAYDGANVWQYDSNGSTAQKWKITKNSDGTYTIKSALNGNYVIDLLYGSSENGTNAQIYSSNGTNAQKYYFDEITAKPEPDPEPVSSGTYTICSALNSSKALDIEWGSTASGANLQIYDSNGTNAQKFKITYDGDGYATIINVNSGKALDVQWGSAYNGANVWQYDSNGSKAQKWKVVNNGDGTYTFKSAINENYVLDISGGSTANGANVQIYSSNGTNAQKFYLK